MNAKSIFVVTSVIVLAFLLLSYSHEPPIPVDTQIQYAHYWKSDTHVYWLYTRPETFEQARKEVMVVAQRLQGDIGWPTYLDDTSVNNKERKIYLARIHVRPQQPL